MASDSRKVKPGIKAQMNRPVTRKAAVMTGKRSVNRLSRSFHKYALGKEIPVKSTCSGQHLLDLLDLIGPTWMAITMRVTSKVNERRRSGSPSTHTMGLTMLAP